jgi:hypothetical protein
MKSQICKTGLHVDMSVERDVGNELKKLNAMGLNPPATDDEVLGLYVILSEELFGEFKKRVSKKSE